MCTPLFHVRMESAKFSNVKVYLTLQFLCEFNCLSIDLMLIADVAAFHHRNFIQRIP